MNDLDWTRIPECQSPARYFMASGALRRTNIVMNDLHLSASIAEER
jgi:hypothetical protein